jgi:peroxiredoxin
VNNHTICFLFAAAALVGCGGSQSTQGGTASPEVDVEGSGGDVTASDGSYESDAPKIEDKGPSAPEFSLPTLDGDEITLSDYQGKKVLLIDFWSTTCDPCLREMPELVKIYDARKAHGFEVLAISVDGPDTAAEIPAKVKSTGMNFPILLDEETEVMDRYNPKGEMPFTVVVSKSGKILLKRAGYQPGDAKSMKELVDTIDGAMRH